MYSRLNDNKSEPGLQVQEKPTIYYDILFEENKY